MSECISFIIGTMVGGLTGVVLFADRKALRQKGCDRCLRKKQLSGGSSRWTFARSICFRKRDRGNGCL